MVVRRGKPLKGFGGDSSSSDSDDGFAAMSKKRKRSGSIGIKPSLDSSTAPIQKDEVADTDVNAAKSTLPNTETSSNKRHHHANASRQAKMDALLQELQSTKPTDPSTSREEDHGSIYAHEASYYGDGYDRPPNKMGSYVEAGKEHLTSNMFVGNLHPTTTEEELTDAFRQFGDLYSVKIMWPRTSEERARNRNTGFVCFMSRKDAEDALDAYCDADVFGNGRRLVLRWGKNVKKTVKMGVGVPSNMRKKPRANSSIKAKEETNDVVTEIKQDNEYSLEENKAMAVHLNDSLKYDTPMYDPVIHSSSAIVVKMPEDERRLKFISTVASFVANDGSQLEQKLIDAEFSNPKFRFLSHGDGDEVQLSEHIYYRWRVYSFCQGDSENVWRTEPFLMFQPHGRWWIPPPLNLEAAHVEEEAVKQREQDRVAAQEERRRPTHKKEFATVREMERAKFSRGELKLNAWEREKFDELLRKKLCASQDSICNAMSYAFEKSGAAREISALLKESLLEQNGGISADTRIARLFLISDILFNSQQPGVKNAFQYRDAIEKMSPEVFESLGRHGDGRAGRMTMSKLRKAVKSVLSAWVNWSVFDSSYIDELECKFEGRKLTVGKIIQQEDEEQVKETIELESSGAVQEDRNDYQICNGPKGAGFVLINEQNGNSADNTVIVGNNLDGEELNDNDLDGEPLSDEDLDGEPLSDGDLDSMTILDEMVDT